MDKIRNVPLFTPSSPRGWGPLDSPVSLSLVRGGGRGLPKQGTVGGRGWWRNGRPLRWWTPLKPKGVYGGGGGSLSSGRSSRLYGSRWRPGCRSVLVSSGGPSATTHSPCGTRIGCGCPDILSGVRTLDPGVPGRSDQRFPPPERVDRRQITYSQRFL